MKPKAAIRWGLSAVGLALAVGLCMPMSASAQTAQISGVISDSSGARVPKANVTVLNNDTGISRSADSNSDGYYALPVLQPGSYIMTVKADGFATQIRTDVTLDVGAQQILNFTLRVGKVEQTVQVTSDAPLIQLATSSISAVVTASTVLELPLNGRSWTDLAILQPSVVTMSANQINADSGNGRGRRGYGSQVAISGARPQQNNYRLDGVSINDYSNGAPGSILGGNLGVDAIQEFSVLTTNEPAEYGKTSGGVINAITRSGTNQFHGDAYEFLRNSALDSRNFFDSATIPAFRRNQFGASIGGPIHKDHTFFFVDYEGIRQLLGITSEVNVPSVAARSGNLCSAPATPSACTPTTVVVNPDVQRFLGLYPIPSGQITSNGDVGIASFAQQQVTAEDFVTGRVDQKFSEKDSLFATYLFDNTAATSPDIFNDSEYGFQTKRQTLVLGETHIFSPTLINTARFGFVRDFVNDAVGASAINPLAADHSLASVPGKYASDVKVSGIDEFTAGLGGNGFELIRWNNFQGYDDLFLNRGTHSIKFGAAVERDQLNELGTNRFNGQWAFSSLANFLTDVPKSFSALLPSASTELGLRVTILGGYVQDDWSLRPNLTVNLGLRYEMATVPTEAHDRLPNLYNLTDATPHLGNPWFKNGTLRDFEPRIGFAWDPFRNSKTAVRGGFGMFDSLPLLYQTVNMIGGAAPYNEVGTANKVPVGGFPFGGFALLSANSSSLTQMSRQFNPSRTYIMEWNLNMQREIVPNLTATLGYVGSHGVHQPFRTDEADMVLPKLTSAGYLWPAPIGSGTKLNPNAGTIRYLNSSGSSFYDGLLVSITKRMTHGLQLQGSFTWSKSIDDNSGVAGSDTFSNSQNALQWFDMRLNRGLSDFNVPRLLVISSTWALPDTKSFGGPAAWAANGWELGAIFTAHDGTPFTPTFGSSGDPAGTEGSKAFDVPDRVTGPGCATLVNPGNSSDYIKSQCFSLPAAPNMAFWQTNCDHTTKIFGTPATTEPYPVCFNLRGNAGRNILPGPGLANLDFSVYKNNPIPRVSESFNVQFRMEFFNVLNHTNFATPAAPSDIFDANGNLLTSSGILTATSTTSRQIQFALKVIF